MRRIFLLTFLCTLSTAFAGAQQAATRPLTIYSIDVEGGQATLLVSPSGQSMLVDTGWPEFEGRDADRIAAAVKSAGLSKLDYVVTTHYHRDHVGGVPQLADRVKIGTFVDHGDNLENAEQTTTGYADYQKVLAKTGAKRLTLKPGDHIPIQGLDVEVLTAAREHIHPPVPTAGQANPLCQSEPASPPDPSENSASLGMVISYGKFRFLDLGDLTKQKEIELVCPNNPIGKVDVFLVSHHGLDQSNSRALVQAVHPRVAIMNNGAHKGGSPAAWQIVHDSPGLEDLWQLHYAEDSDKSHNSADNLIANLSGTDAGNYLKLVAEPDGSFMVWNSRNNYRKSYAPVQRNPAVFSRLPAPRDFDYSQAAIETIERQFRSPEDFGSRAYPRGLFLYGSYLVYKRTGNHAYLDFIKGWVDSHLDAEGHLKHNIDSLDSMLAGNLFIVLYRETKDERYHTAAVQMRERLNTYPRTKEGAVWHATSRQWQTWLDGIYMSMPLLARYGQTFNDSQYANDEVTKQILLYAKHLNDPTSGLMYHAYDESGQQPWADPATHHSSQFWCRAIGWYGMAIVDVLDIIPRDHPQRDQLVALVQQLVKAYAKYQDTETGLWFEVVDRGELPDNWLETSSSSMYTYTISRAVERGYVGREYEKYAQKGYRGVLASITRNSDGTIEMPNICEGTNVGDLAFYLGRARHTNDLHGLGAFIIMNEQMRNAH
ncbi:MAG: glycoside hydrolase family 88 protein [Acidobacteria bacterium]|nr:glycoside hydrolase family 88 protein [Acidobacteriota bacterium]